MPFAARAVFNVVQMARGLTALAAGRHADAYDQLRRLFDPADPAHHVVESPWAIGNLAEAAVHSDHVEEARVILRSVAPLTDRTPSPWLHVAVRHARALLADDAHAEELFQAGVASRHDAMAIRSRPASVSLRCLASSPKASRGLSCAAARCTRHLRRSWSDPVGGPGAPGTPGSRRAAGSATPRRCGATEPSGAPDRADGGCRSLEPRDRRATVPLTPNGRRAPLPDLPEAWSHVAPRSPRRDGHCDSGRAPLAYGLHRVHDHPADARCLGDGDRV